MKEQFSVNVVGATGYAGAELVRLLSNHPAVRISSVTSGRSAGKVLREECPWLDSDLVLSSFDPAKPNADFTFLCQEAGFAMEHAAELTRHTRVIDLSADFRLSDPGAYRQYYGREHTAQDVSAVYGLPELCDRDAIAGARMIANPGCYPTASLLALMPLVRAGVVADSGVVVIDAKSGVSGAGRSKKETDFLFSELAGGFKAYAVAGHRHTPEIEQMAGLRVRFTPHLIPVPRGLHSTVHVPLNGDTDLEQIFASFYADEPFVVVQGATPSIKQVVGSNRCAISTTYDAHTGYAVICSVIDNLVKGAAGQAIQNMNLMAGLPEGTGLTASGVWP